MKVLKRTWADISLDNLEHNYRTLREHVGKGPRFLGVVKADSYGHGAVQVSRTLEELGREFNVTRERIRQIEAKALRKIRHPGRSKKLRDYYTE